MYHRQILELIEKCRMAGGNGVRLKEIRLDILPELIKPLLENSVDFLNWVKEDREYALFYFDVQESGVCAKPRETAALILEAIIVDALELNIE
jgi:hypothetical protein